MNEQIKKLGEQAGFEGKDGHISIQGVYMFNTTRMEKFAELIVRECVGCCEQVISDPVPESVDTWLNGGSQCIDEIKQHFGVE